MRKRKVRIKSLVFFVIGILFVGLFIFFPILLSADPLDNWQMRNPIPQGNSLFAITYGNNTFIAVGDSGTILSSVDSITWNSRSSGVPNGLNGITYGNNIFVAVMSRLTGTYWSDAILTSVDGITWTRRSSGATNTLLGIINGNNTFVAVGCVFR